MFFSESDFSALSGKYIFLDNDFLGKLYSDEYVLAQCIDKFKTSYLAIDDFNKFEFLRDVFLPQQRTLKEQFLSLEIFYPVEFHQETLRKIYDNALLISQIYSHANHNKGWGTVDLLLAGRIVYHYKNSVLITGNRKHFSSVLFDTVGLLNTESQDGTVQTFYIIALNKEKFDKAVEKLNRL